MHLFNFINITCGKKVGFYTQREPSAMGEAPRELIVGVPVDRAGEEAAVVVERAGEEAAVVIKIS